MTDPAQPTNGAGEWTARRFDRLPEAATFANADDLDVPLGEMRALLTGGRLPEELQSRAVAYLDALERKQLRLDKLAQYQAELTRRFTEAEQLVQRQAAIGAIEDVYRQAEEYIKGRRQTADDWDESDLSQLRLLEADAHGRFEKFRVDHALPQTRVEGDELVALIVKFANDARRNPRHQVSYFTEPRPDAVVQSQNVEDALAVAKAFLFAFWDGKIVEYLSTARERREKHRPREAYAAWQRCEELPGLNNPLIGLSLSPLQQARIAEVKKEIDADLINLSAAEEELKLAAAELNRKPPAPLAAEVHRKKAQQKFADVEGLSDLQRLIVDAARKQIPDHLAAAETALRAEAWSQAVAHLDDLKKLLDLLGAAELPVERAHYVHLRAVADVVAPLNAAPPPAPDAQRDTLLALQRDYNASADDFWASWPGLQRRLARLQALGNVTALRAAIDAACKPGATTAALEEAISAVQAVQRRPPAGMQPDELESLVNQLPRLMAWQGFARARDELAKAPQSNAQATADETAWANLPDLQIVADGLEAADANNQAKEAARSAGLAAKLAQLRQNDSQAKARLDAAQSFLRQSPSHADTGGWRAQRSSLLQALSLPSSHRRDLLAANQLVSAGLAERLRDGIQTRLDAAHPAFNTSDPNAPDWLDIQALEKEFGELKNLVAELGEEQIGWDYAALTHRVALARAFAAAQKSERQNRDSLIPRWKELREAWEAALRLADDDRDAYSYAHTRSRLAHKQAQFAETRGALPKTAESILEQLTADPLLRDDWEVWLRYGDFVFGRARAALSPDGEFSRILAETPAVAEWLEKAQSAYQHGVGALQGRPLHGKEETAAQQRMTSLLPELEKWSALQRAAAAYRAVLEQTQGISHADCRKLMDSQQAAAQTMGDNRSSHDGLPNIAEWHSRLWGQARALVDRRLREEIKALTADDILDRFDKLLGRTILSPDDLTRQAELRAEWATTLHALQQRIDDTVGDSDGRAFSRRHQLRTGQPPSDEMFIALQLADVTGSHTRLREYRETLNLNPLAKVAIDDALLQQMEDRLAEWAGRLDEFKKTIDAALTQAEDGMGEPRQLAAARYVLRLDGLQTLDRLQTPEEFVNAAHPAYRHAKAIVEEDNRRRERQVELNKQIAALTTRERESVTLALRLRAGEAVSEAEIEQVNQLPTVVHELKQKLDALTSEEPTDPTRLQQQMTYRLPEDGRTEYRSSASIANLIDTKLRQYETLRQWLRQWQGHDGAEARLINWSAAKTHIERLRDSGDDGLNRALALVRDALGATQDTLPPRGALPLLPARRALSWEGMLSEIRPPASSATIGDGDEPLLFGLCEPINQGRLALSRRLDREIRENEALTENILWRIRHYQSYWDEFDIRKTNLMVARKPFRKTWSETREYREFEVAAEAFCRICPNDPTFLEALAEAQRKTGLRYYCPPQEGNRI